MNANVAPNANQTLLLWRILACGKVAGEILQKDLGVEVKAEDRRRLVLLGFLEDPGKKAPLKLKVTDEGWRWAHDNLSAELPKRASAKIAPLLQRWLTLLHGYLERQGVSIADLFRSAGGAVPRKVVPHEMVPHEVDTRVQSNGAHKSLHDRVRTEYLALTRGEIKTRCLLRDLRERLSDVSRANLDVTIGNMVTSGEAVLFRLDNRLEITPADIHAAIHAGGEQQHILWLDR
jgi:hypothetical protein